MGDGREKWDERDLERGWCSHCVKLGDHTKQVYVLTLCSHERLFKPCVLSL